MSQQGEGMSGSSLTGREGGRRVRLLGAAVGAAAIVAAGGSYQLAQWLAADHVSSEIALPGAPVVSQAAFQAKTGVRITQLAVTGNGGLLDLRFQVVDSGKAAAVHSAPPMLVDERTGVVVRDLFMGHKHKGLLKAGQSYYLIFTNPGNLVERGSRATVQLGPVQVAHVDVR